MIKDSDTHVVVNYVYGDFYFSGTEEECDNWMKVHNHVLCGMMTKEAYLNTPTPIIGSWTDCHGTHGSFTTFE